MTERGGMYAISNQKEFDAILDSLALNTEKRKRSGNLNAIYIAKKRGVVIQIIHYIRK